MSRWSGTDVARALGLESAPVQSFASIRTDTRTLEPGALFVALEGERFDAHDFLDAAKRADASGAVVRRGTPPLEGLPLFEVDDTLDALGRLGRARRRRVRGPVVGITGTNGKTTTRTMVESVLGTKFRVHATVENQNNLVGVPLTLLEAPEDCDALVVECGANVPGEIARLRDVLEPSVAVVTNISAGHLAGFGTIEQVLVEKAELARSAPLALVGTEPLALGEAARQLAQRARIVGFADWADVRPEACTVDAEARATIRFRGHSAALPVAGRHQAENALLALALAEELELDLRRVAAALAAVRLPHGRCEILRSGDLVILYDAYNANPESVAAALATAGAMRGKRRLAIGIGTMLELGSDSEALHERVAEDVVESKPDLIVCTGDFTPAFARHAARLGKRLVPVGDAESVGRTLARRLRGDELVLLKASRGVHLERAVSHLIPQSAVPCSITS